MSAISNLVRITVRNRQRLTTFNSLLSNYSFSRFYQVLTMSNPSFDHNFSYISSHPADYSHSSWQPLVKTPGPSRLATLCRFFSCTRARLWPSSQKESTRTNSFFCAELTDWSAGRTGAWVVSCAPNGRCAPFAGQLPRVACFFLGWDVRLSCHFAVF